MQAASIDILRDIYSREVPASSNPEFLGAAGNTMIFSAALANQPRRLYRSDGTTGSTLLLAAASSRSNPRDAVTVGNRVVFFAEPPASLEREIWATDGTEAGTLRLAISGRDQIPFWIAQTATFALVSVQRMDGNYDIWRSDGTVSGTFPILQQVGQATTGAAADGGFVYFGIRNGSDTVHTLYQTNGQAGAGTRVVFQPAATGLQVFKGLAVNGNLAIASGRDESNTGLFSVDLASGTASLLSRVGGTASDEFVRNSVWIGTTLFFIGNTQVWRSDGTVGGTLALTTFSLTGVEPPLAALGGNRVVFVQQQNGTGRELWVTDGTVVGTQIVREAVPGPEGEARIIGNTADAAFVVAGSGISNGVMQLWITDGTDAGTRTVPQRGGGNYDVEEVLRGFVHGDQVFFHAGLVSTTVNFHYWRTDTAGTDVVRLAPGFHGAAAAGGRFYFAGIGPGGAEPWVSDGTPAGTSELADLARSGRTGDSNPSQFARLGNELIFVADDGEHGTELWTTDGTTQGTRLVRDLTPGPNGTFITGLIQRGSVVYFTAKADDGSTSDTPPALWRTDRTEAGTFKLNDIGPIKERLDGSCANWAETLDNGRVWIVAATDLSAPRRFWSTDGTVAGTREEFALPAKIAAAGGEVCDLTALGDGIIFAVDTGTDREVWRTDGTAAGTARVRDINTNGSGLASPFRGFTTLNGFAYFLADDGVTGTELWRTDGTAGNTHLVVDLAPGAGGIHNFGAAPLGNVLLFAATAPFTGQVPGVFRTDGTAAGTVRLAFGGLVETVTTPVVAGSRAFFTASQSLTGRLWVTDGTQAGTRLVVSAPVNTSFGANALVGTSDGTLFFSGSLEGTTGDQLWMSDGTAAGTRRLSNFPIDTGLNIEGALTTVADRPLFIVRDTQRGKEPYVVSNQNPIGNPDSATTTSGASTVVSVLANDTDPDGTIAVAGVFVVAPPANGNAAVEGNAIRYTAPAGFTGTVAFDYRLIDDFGAGAGPVRVTITVNPAVAAPEPPGGGGGGSGRTNPALLLVLGALLALAARRRDSCGH